jgi:WD40 repeat protein
VLKDGDSRSQLVATGGDDKYVYVWGVKNGINFASLSGSPSPITALAMDKDEMYIVSGAEGGSIRVHDLEVVSH